MKKISKTLCAIKARDIADSMKALRQRAAALRTTSSAVNALAKRTAHLAIASRWIDVDGLSSPSTNCKVTLCLYFDKLDGMKDPVLAEVLAAYLDSESQRTADFPSFMNRDFFFTYPGGYGGVDVEVKVVAYVKANSVTCRKVQISVKTRVVDESVYELVCD